MSVEKCKEILRSSSDPDTELHGYKWEHVVQALVQVTQEFRDRVKRIEGDLYVKGELDE